jgi:hypothetical protein
MHFITVMHVRFSSPSNSARAFIEVAAKDATSAKTKAQIYLSQVLDSLVFSAADRSYSIGFKPQLG